MHTQSDLGFPGNPSLAVKSRDRRSGSSLFIALRPDPLAATKALDIAYDIRTTYRVQRQPLSSGRLHVSMINLGHEKTLDESTVFQARQAIDSVRFEPFELSFDLVASFRSETAFPIVLCPGKPCLPLIELQRRLAHALDGVGVGHNGSLGFEPHMTLIYHHMAIEPAKLASPISMVVDQAWLIHSLVGQTRYEFLWPLRQ